MNIYLRSPKQVFRLWKWIIFGPLFLLALDYVSSQLADTYVMRLAIGLGFLITARMFLMKRSIWGLLSGLGLSLLISSIASAYLYTLCWVHYTEGLCESRPLQAYIISNYLFPNLTVIFWIALQIILAIGKNIAYILRYTKR